MREMFSTLFAKLALLLTKLNVVATARASFYLYNTQDEVDLLVEGIGRVRDMFR